MHEGPVDNLDEDTSEKLRSLKNQVARSVSEMARSELKDLLETEILLELLKGQRTVNELVEAIYHLGSNHPGYRTYYSRVSRSLGDMRSRGWVSRQLLGKEKPYRITALAVARISAIDGVGAPVKLFSRGDILLYSLSIFLGVSSSFLAIVVESSTGNWFPVIFSLFLFTSGGAIVRFYETIRSVA